MLDRMIVGGDPIPVEQVPWQVSVQIWSDQGYRHWCGGSIIDRHWILTANHCLDDYPVSQISVVAGTADLSDHSEGQRKSVEKAIRYLGYVEGKPGKDVALLRLSESLHLDGTTVATIGLVDAEMADEGATDLGTAATVTGWGFLNVHDPRSSDLLQMAEFPIVDNQDANLRYDVVVGDDELAAGGGGTSSKGTCYGDSGGPLTIEWEGVPYLAGVVSRGHPECETKGFPGIYARVSFFAAWIARETRLQM